MRLTTSLLVLTAICAAAPERYEIRPSADSSLELIVEKTGLLRGKKHLFVFERYSGTLQLDEQRPEASRVSFSIEARSGICKDTWLSAKDLKKVQEYAWKEMLAVDRHPRIDFASTAIRTVAPGEYEVSGALTIRGISKPAVVMVKAAALSGPRFTGRSTIKLTDYGLKPPSAALGAIGTKDQMSLTFRIDVAR
jgi:polyisoprenoid-binding protein YceI